MGAAAPVKGVIGAGEQIASLFGGGGGGGGGGQGVSPQEAALAQYTQHQAELGVLGQFANTGTGHSTNETQAVSGTRIAEALNLAGISDQNQAATTSGLQQLAQQQASAAGEAAGQSQGGQGFSSSPGSFGSSTDSTSSPSDATTTG
jgi:hypothetical protein